MDNQQAPSPVQLGARTILQQKVFVSVGAKFHTDYMYKSLKPDYLEYCALPIVCLCLNEISIYESYFPSINRDIRLIRVLIIKFLHTN